MYPEDGALTDGLTREGFARRTSAEEVVAGVLLTAHFRLKSAGHQALVEALLL